MGVLDELATTQDSGFGCAITNRFDRLLDDEADPFDLLREAQAEKHKKKKKEEPKKAGVAKPGKKESQKDRKVPLPAGGGDAGQKLAPRVGQSEERRVVFQERRYNEMETPLEYSIERPQEQLDRSGRGGRGAQRGRPGRGGVYPRNTDAGDQRRKREFDRHSGSVRTGVRPEEKRGGNGSHNWGSMKDQLSAVGDGSPHEEGGDSEEVQEAVEVDGEPCAPEGDGEAVVEVAVEMSLDEWKALQEQSRPKTEFNLRKADASMPSKAVVIHQSRHTEDMSDGLQEDEEDGHYFRRPANDITCKVEINFGCLDRPMRGGRGRGGRGRVGPASHLETAPQLHAEAILAPNPDDPEDFPALTAGGP
ncbi:intracellular hyaluronan-binding protein 4 [Megalops cyprinoides]|uniref:intracellular hyaluronan-binding protein 4 n=1 Tax=Megalops cyprinoides TaxID=118141 RepID=UPI0018644F02|nr:intracellular hyaluronan-binding protein 4 [Megalops cyprinoides]